MTKDLQPWSGFRLVPLVVLDNAEDVNPVMDALQAGGISIIEIALRTEAALSAITIAAARNDFVVAAGTLTDPELVPAAITAGASFGLSPASQDSVLDRAQQENWPFIPAIGTVSEAQRMLDRGLSHLKVFPADLVGGEKFLTVLASVMPNLKALPSGGISESNLRSYLSQPNVFAVSGSWIAPRNLIADKQFDEIRARAMRASEIAQNNG